ncbi:hypothetical protein TNIN_457381 [Trichonephila inaurata madagascariensis]|uniref:Uncharacterized protein n=1 Tax=Trichonephila inaurata madagascariensis TaxID=2747483 RepID=A0A8X6MIB9_9ARAC|nr:hypothetical protein TNIN_457381 [Trichonephila inaurata madagascariensis]
MEKTSEKGSGPQRAMLLMMIFVYGTKQNFIRSKDLQPGKAYKIIYSVEQFLDDVESSTGIAAYLVGQKVYRLAARGLLAMDSAPGR